MEILNCEYENKKLEIKTPTNNLLDIVNGIRQNFWDVENDLNDFYILENMKFYNDIISNAVKTAGKNAIKNNKRAELIKFIYNQTQSERTCRLNFSDKNKKKLKIDYYCLESIAYVICKLINTFIRENDYPIILNDVIDNNYFSKVYDCQIWNTTLMNLKNEFNQVEIINFELSSSNDREFQINYIILFYHFYKVFFPNVKSISINLDFHQLNKKYMDLKNPYDFKETKIKDLCKNMHNIFRANYILVCLFSVKSLKKLKIKSTESYINEIYYIIGQEYSKKKENEPLLKNKGLILFKELMKIKGISKLNISINCLDRFLFNETIDFITLVGALESLKLNLFYNPNFFKKRKIYLNYLFGQEYYEIDPNLIDKYGIIYYPYVDKLGEEINSVIDDEKILDLIFPEFKKNITNLKIILKEYIGAYTEFCLNISPYDELNKCQNYNVQIFLFIIAILASIENSKLKVIESLELNCANFDYVNTSLIMENINRLIQPKLIDLSTCEKLHKLSLNIQGVSLFLDIDKLPLKSLTKFEILISNLADFEKIKSIFEKGKNDITKLEQFNILFPLIDDTNNILNKFYIIFEYLPQSLKQLNISNENIMSKEQFLDIISKIQKNNISINCEFICDCFELREIVNENSIESLKKLLNSKGNINVDNCDIFHENYSGFKFVGNNQNFKVILN